MNDLYVIIPVYKGVEATRACVDSVLSHTKKYSILIINDASPDADIKAYLDSLCLPDLFISHNPINMGFVKTVNRGFDFDTQKDVVILNSDTIVTAGWIEKLRTWAYSDANAATVTPMSNNATICSYPKICSQNYLPDNLTPDALNLLFEKASALHADEIIDIPTGVGFCLYIKREFLEKAGYFDETLFGTGYGEENDFCMRCTKKGGRHLVAADTYIFHNEGVSFGAKRKQKQTKKAIKTLNLMYPGYNEKIQHFMETDSLISIRRSVDMLRFSASNKKAVLFVSHGKGGGVDKHVRDLSGMLESESCRSFLLAPLKNRGVALSCVSPAEEFYIEIDSKNWLSKLVIFLKYFKVCHLHYHHIMDYHEDIYRLPEEMGLFYDFTLHDFYMFCPNISGYVDAKDDFCGFNSQNSCKSCSYTNQESAFIYNPYKSDIEKFRKTNRLFLKKARKIIAPSQSTRSIYNQYYPELNIEVFPHPELYLFEDQMRVNKLKISGSKQNRFLKGVGRNKVRLNVGLLGGLSPKKGRRVFERCLALSRKRALPVRWILVGYADHSQFSMADDLVITGQYDKDDLPALFVQYGIQIVLLPAKWPETYSYTLSECLALKCPVIVPSIGAFEERVRERRGGVILPSPISADSIIEQIEQLVIQPDLIEDFKNKILPSNNEGFKTYFYDIYKSLTFTGSCTNGFTKDWLASKNISDDFEGCIPDVLEQLVRQFLCKQSSTECRKVKMEFLLTRNHVKNLGIHIGNLETILESERKRQELTQCHVVNIQAENELVKKQNSMLQNELQVLIRQTSTIRGVACSFKFLLQRGVISFFRRLVSVF